MALFFSAGSGLVSKSRTRHKEIWPQPNKRAYEAPPPPTRLPLASDPQAQRCPAPPRPVGHRPFPGSIRTRERPRPVFVLLQRGSCRQPHSSRRAIRSLRLLAPGLRGSGFRLLLSHNIMELLGGRNGHSLSPPPGSKRARRKDTKAPLCT